MTMKEKQEHVNNSVPHKGKLKLKLMAIDEEKLYDGKNISSIAPVVFGDIPNDYVAVLTQRFKTKNVGQTFLVPYILVFNKYGESVECEVSKQVAKGVIKPGFIRIGAQTDIKEYDGTTISSVEPVPSKQVAQGDILKLFQEFETPLVGKGKNLLPAFQIDDGNGGKNYEITLLPIKDGEILSSSGGGIEALQAISDYLGTDNFTISQLNGLVDFVGEICATDEKKIYLRLEARKREIQVIEVQRSFLNTIDVELGEKIRVALKNRRIEVRSMKRLPSVSRSLNR